MPNAEPPECRRCQTAMQRGFVLDFYSVSNQDWIPGDPGKGFALTIKIRRRPHFPVVTYRCPACGSLESFAPEQT